MNRIHCADASLQRGRRVTTIMNGIKVVKGDVEGIEDFEDFGGYDDL